MASSVSVSVNLYYILAHKSAALVGRLPKRRTLSHLVGLKSVKFSHRNTGICFTTDAFVVADDAKYGNKQVISLTPRLYDYVIANVREPEVSSIALFSYLTQSLCVCFCLKKRVLV